MPILGPKANADPVQNLIDNFSALQGPFLVGTALQGLLCGVIVVQSYDYFTLYRKDSWMMKAFIFTLVLLNVVDCSMDIASVYDQYITHFGDYIYLLSPPNFEVEHLVISATISLFAQGFFAARSYKVNKSIILAVIMSALTLLTAALGYTVAWRVANVQAGYSIGDLLLLVEVECWAAVACDLLISAVFAQQMRASSSGFNSTTDSILGRLLRMSLGTAASTTLVVIVDALAFALNDETSNFSVATGLMIPRVYTICLIYVLNARHGLRLVADGPSQFQVTSTNNQARGSRFGRHKDVSAFNGVTVHLDTIVAHDKDTTDDLDFEESGKRRTHFV